ncbi:hypothetical protein ACH5AL_06105 [Actinacidiphila glaucinigra]|uniref:hypothetical protein n=1 Tax=Actinacidiphila glaucinigra TaxID=235986 RepID=UPI003795F8D8
MTNDPVLDAVRELRPHGAEGWARSDHGRETLQSVLGAVGPRGAGRRSLRVLVAGGAAVAALAGGGVVAVAGGMPWGEDAGAQMMCARTLARGADLSGLPSDAVKEFDPKDPGAVCARRWKEMWGPSEPVPTSFAACYYPGAAGKVVWPADGLGQDEACARIGARPIPAG